MNVTSQQISGMFPHCKLPDAWAAALNAAMTQFDIMTPRRAAAFLSQIAYESGEFNHLTESLDYSPQRLLVVWPKRFPTLQTAIPYAHDPEKLANYVYAKRLGNGDVSSGDGWKYRGRGVIQLTGRANYHQAGAEIGMPIEDQPDLLLLPDAAARSAAFFWRSHGLNQLADDENDDNDDADFVTITVKINGSDTGIEGRRGYWAAAKAELGIT